MPFDILTIILATICATVGIVFGYDIMKNPDEVPDKCKFCQWRWECRVVENGVCLREGEKID